jgi:flagellar hook-associated protein 3 FlgL
MRVTANTYSSSLISQLNSLASRQLKLQTQAATGQRVQLPSDDPAAMRRVLNLQAEARNVDQYQRNIQRHRELAATAYTSLKSLKNISDRANEIAMRADGLKSPEELAIFAGEINQLLQQAVQLANAQQGGSHLFAGTRSDQPPFGLVTDAAGRITAVNYQGNDALAPTEIGEGVTLSVLVAGTGAGGTESRGLITDSTSGADFFSHLISLRDHLLAGDVAAIATTDHAQLVQDGENFIFHLGRNAAIQSRLEAAASLMNARAVALESRVSHEADADLADTLVRLNQTQTAYQAALQSGARLFDRSLMDFLR